MKTLQTERLRLRIATQDDADFIKQLYNTPDFIQFVGDKKIRSVGDAEQYIQNNILAMRKEFGVCLLVVETLATGLPIGVCGLIKRPELDAYDIGFGYLPSAYGQGIGYEAAMAVLSYARQQPHINELVAITTSDNHGCQALLNKLGFTYIKVQDTISDTIDLLLFQYTLEG